MVKAQAQATLPSASTMTSAALASSSATAIPELSLESMATPVAFVVLPPLLAAAMAVAMVVAQAVSDW